MKDAKRLFKIRIKLECNGEWDVDGSSYLCYILKETKPNGNIVSEYSNVDTVSENSNSNTVSEIEAATTLYGTAICIPRPEVSSPRYVRGIVRGDKLIFMIFAEDDNTPPICCYTSILKGKGFWSKYDAQKGFFPVLDACKCSDGHVKAIISQVPCRDFAVKSISETCDDFLKHSHNKLNVNLISTFKGELEKFLDNNHIDHMELHCGSS